MRRFVSLAVLLFFTVPFGASLVGCGHKTVVQYCNGGDSGPVVGQIKSITLSPSFAVFGESIDYGQMGSSLSATAVDCKGSPVEVSRYTYATSDMTIADINPSNGVVCGGTFNRNTGGGIPDYTTCTAPKGSTATINTVSVTSNVVTLTALNTFTVGEKVTFAGLHNKAAFLNGQTLAVVSTTGTNFTVNFATPDLAATADLGTATGTVPTASMAFVTATASGAVSNAIPVYIHPTVTSITIGNPTSSCSTDPDTSCCPITTGAVITAPAYTGTSCLSQGVSAQLTARAYKNGTTNPADNITCQIGHLQYAAQNSSVFTVDQNGVVTAAQPGSSIVTASVSTSGSGGAAGFFATCPPASIVLSVPGQAGATGVNVNVNTNQPLTATVLDTNNVTLTGVNLTFNSTTPSTIPAGSGIINPSFPGSAAITAVCQPPTCNSAPFTQLGVFGNGKPITSNNIQITAPGSSATVLYIGSTQSQYLLPVDFSTGQQGSLVKLPYTPNSMVITNDGSSIFLGSSTAMMSVSAVTNDIQGTFTNVPGTVLSVSPNGQTVVVVDPVRQTVSLVSTGGAVQTTYGATGTRAQWSPDSNTVYITAANNQLLVHSTYTGWYATPTGSQYVDVAVMVPSVGAFFATNTTTTEGRSYCPLTTSTSTDNPPVTTNTYYPVANDTAAKTDRIAATNDGNHILGATATPATLNDIGLTIPPPTAAGSPLNCTTTTGPITFATTVVPHLLPGIVPTAITGVYPASNSALAFVTYTGTSGLLPEYIPANGATLASVSNVTLSSGAVAPVSGVFATDNKTFYTGTSGDNQVHLITVNGTAATDTSVIAPKLPGASGNTVVPDLLVQRPKKTTS